MHTATLSTFVTPAQQRQYHEQGYMILPGIIPPDMLTALREECAYFVGYADAQMDINGSSGKGLSHRGKRYFIGNRYRMSQRMHRFLYGELMAQVAAATLGPEVYLFNEQWVVKGAEQGMKFGWHQDSGYVKFADPKTTHAPYLSCWCPLDDVSEENGTVYVLPHERAGTSAKIFDHTREDVTNDLIGYTGNDPGVPIIAPAGSIVAFSSYTFHRSGANTTPAMRRVYLAQYSSTPIMRNDGAYWAQAVPFLKDGQNIYDRTLDTEQRWKNAVPPKS